MSLFHSPQISLVIILLALLSSCFGVDETNRRLAAIEKNTAQLNSEIASYKEYVATLTVHAGTMTEQVKATNEQMRLATRQAELIQENLASLNQTANKLTPTLNSMSDYMKTVANSFAALTKLGGEVVKKFLEHFTKDSPPAKTPDLDDFLGAEAETSNPK